MRFIDALEKTKSGQYESILIDANSGKELEVENVFSYFSEDPAKRVVAHDFMINRRTNTAIILFNKKEILLHNLDDYNDRVMIKYEDPKPAIFGCPCVIGESIYVILLNQNAILEIKPSELSGKSSIVIDGNDQPGAVVH